MGQMEHTQRLAEQIATQLRDAIADGTFELGERLSEEMLSEALGVSRTPIRDALSQLRSEGLVRVVPKSGTYIFSPEIDQIHELCECRTELESLALKLALQRRKEPLLNSLEQLCSEMDTALKGADTQQYNRLDAQFHLALLDHCENRYIQSSYKLIHASVGALRSHMTVHTEGALELSLQEHREIISLARSSNIKAASTVIAQHISRAEANYAATLTKVGAEQAQSRQAQLAEKLSRFRSR